jgi:hypothetical protein
VAKKYDAANGIIAGELLSENEQKLLCMGHTYTANKPLPLNNSPKEVSVSWESNPARVKASGWFPPNHVVIWK